MRFGDKLRELRNDKDLTQPGLAEALGIEQSYLSKLENGKSLPSNDTLNRILDYFGLQVGDVVNDLDQGARNQMRQIPVVADYFRREKQLLIGNQKRWLLVSALTLSLGMALIYAGYVHLFFPNIVYQYKSHGIVRDGEPKEIFRMPSLLVPDSSDHKARIEVTDAIKARTNENFMFVNDFRGSVFNVPVAGGSRTYYLNGEKEIDPWQSKLVVFFGVFLSVFGAFGLFIERKLARHH